MSGIEQDTFRLLLVEDNPADAALTGARLDAVSDHDFRIRTTASLRDAIAEVQVNNIDAVLLDLNLPDSHGIDTLIRLRAAREDIPIIIISGDPDETLRRNALAAGAQDFLNKDEPASRLLARCIVYAVERFHAQKAHKQMMEIVNANPDAALLVDQAGVVQYVNDAALRLFQRTREDFIGELLGFSIGGESGDIEILRGKERRTGAMRVADVEWRGKRATLASIRDVTETRMLAEQLRQAQKMEALGMLAGGVAHDFNNLLVIMMSNADYLLETLEEGNPLREPAQQIEQASERARQLTSQLLFFSRKQPAQLAIVNPNDLVLDLFKMLRRGLPESIELSFLPMEEAWSLRGDPAQLNQVLMNLSVNAKHAMPTGGRLQIEVRNVTLTSKQGVLSAGDYVCWRVTDTGTGIPEENLARIFEPFFTTKEAGIGTGLGLATCQRIIHQAGGDITVDSELGKGTTFSVFLPRVEQLPQQSTGKQQDEPKLRGHETILVVEDDQAVAHALTQVLSRRGFRVLRAANGEQAKRTIERGEPPIDLVLSDIVMPQMSGSELSEWLAAAHPRMKLLFITGYSEDSEIFPDSVGHEMRGLLRKPFMPAQLIRSVREMLDKPIL